MRQLRELILWSYYEVYEGDYAPLRGETCYSHLIVDIFGPQRTLKTTWSIYENACHIESSCAPLHSMFMQDLISQRPDCSHSYIQLPEIPKWSAKLFQTHTCRAGLSALTFLDVSAEKPFDLNDGDLLHICSLAQLQSLSLANRRFTPSTARSLSRLTSLSVLSLVGCRELDYCLQHFCTLPLAYLYISKSCKSTGACLKTKMAIYRASLSQGFEEFPNCKPIRDMNPSSPLYPLCEILT